MTVLPELFRCAVYDCRLTHSACALQPDELLRAAGWDAQAVGVGPAGRIVIVVRGVAA